MRERINVSSQEQIKDDQALVGLLARFRKMNQEEQEATLSCYQSLVEQFNNGVAIDDMVFPEMTSDLAKKIVGHCDDGDERH